MPNQPRNRFPRSTVMVCAAMALTAACGSPTPEAGPSITGKVVNATTGAGVDAVVSVEGQTARASTSPSDGTFVLFRVASGPVFLHVDPGNMNPGLLPTDTRLAINAPVSGSTDAGTLLLSDPPNPGATYTGMDTACLTCHPKEAAKFRTSALWRSLYRIKRTDPGSPLNADSGEWANAGVLNDKPLTAPRVVMVPLAGTIQLGATLVPPAATAGFAINTTSVVGTGSHWATGINCSYGDQNSDCALIPGDVLGYTPAGLGWTAIGTIQAVVDDIHLTLAQNAHLAATYDPALTPVLSLTGAKYSVARLSRTGLAAMLPVDVNDIVAPAWPGVKATNPNYAPTDPCIYGSGACIEGGTTKYSDGQVQVYLCNLKGSAGYPRDEFAQKFGGSPYTCTDGSFWDGSAALPPVPMVHVTVIYGGRGDEVDNTHQPKPNMNIAKQRWLGSIADVRATRYWTNSSGSAASNGYDDPPSRDLDSFILPIQILQHGTPVNGAYKMNGYHPTENKFPGESWTQRSRTFAHACAGCHNTGLQYTYNEEQITNLPFVRDDGTGVVGNPQVEFNVTGYKFIDENISCEQCHGPASQHASASSITPSRVNGGKIINPKYLTAEMERQQCGKCHAFDDGGRANLSRASATANLLEASGDSAPWNSAFTGQLGNGDYVPGVYDLFPVVVDPSTGKNRNPAGDGSKKGGFLGHYEDRMDDEEAFWNTDQTSGVLLGQQHRQQYTMLAQSKHVSNLSQKLTCSSCHDSHDTYLGNPAAVDAASHQWVYGKADYRNNVACLSCHAGSGDYAGVTKADVAEIHLDYIASNHGYSEGGDVTVNGNSYASAGAAALAAAKQAIAGAVTAHMATRAKMVLTTAVYNPTSESDYVQSPAMNGSGTVTNGPVGRCTSCHMPMIAKSGRYWTGSTATGDSTIIDGDQASHVFDTVMPSADLPLSVSGPTFQSGQYDYWVGPAGGRYQLYGRLPSACGRCHTTARQPAVVVPDLPPGTGVWPAFWPLSKHVADVPATIPTSCGTGANGMVKLCTTTTAP